MTDYEKWAEQLLTEYGDVLDATATGELRITNHSRDIDLSWFLTYQDKSGKLKYLFDDESKSYLIMPIVTATEKIDSRNLKEMGIEIFNLYIPEPVRSIAPETFAHAPWTSCIKNGIFIGKNVEKIGESAFSGMTSIHSVDMQVSAVDEIAARTFSNCKSLNSVSLPQSLKRISHYAFSGCSELESISLPTSIEYVGPNAFYACPKLKKIFCDNEDVAKELKREYKSKRIIYNGEDIRLPLEEARYSWFERFNGPKNNTSNDKSLLEEFIEKFGDVLDIDDNGIFKITDHSLDAEIQSFIAENEEASPYTPLRAHFTEEDTRRLCLDMTIDASHSAEKKLVIFFGTTKDVKVPADIKYIGEESFKDSDVKSVEMPDTVDTIFRNAFEDCSELKSVKLSKQLKRIGAYAFESCGNLKTISSGDALKYIGEGAFFGCESLKELDVSKSGKIIIGDYAFEDCLNLEKLTLPVNAELGNDILEGCDNLKTIVCDNEDICAKLQNYVLTVEQTEQVTILCKGEIFNKHA